MCSNPVYLKETGMLDLAVKNSSHPPAHWIHNEVEYHLVYALYFLSCSFGNHQFQDVRMKLVLKSCCLIQPILTFLPAV